MGWGLNFRHQVFLTATSFWSTQRDVHISSHLILSTTLATWYSYPHFKEEETEVWRDELICSGSGSLSVAELALGTKCDCRELIEEK